MPTNSSSFELVSIGEHQPIGDDQSFRNRGIHSRQSSFDEDLFVLESMRTFTHEQSRRLRRLKRDESETMIDLKNELTFSLSSDQCVSHVVLFVSIESQIDQGTELFTVSTQFVHLHMTEIADE
jgi:hypothetical protein